MRVPTKRCAYCGRFFRPDYRQATRQKACRREECRRRRRREAQRRWSEKNPGYFKGRYEDTRTWRLSHEGYQRRWRQKRREIQDTCERQRPLKSVRLLVPGFWLNRKIQDTMAVVTAIDSTTYMAMGRGGEIQDAWRGRRKCCMIGPAPRGEGAEKERTTCER